MLEGIVFETPTPSNRVSSACHLRDESSDSDESASGVGESSEVCLKLSNLESYHAGSGDASHYAENGANPKRIKALLDHPPCDCGCRMPYPPLLKACRTFWALPKHSQDAVLWSLQCGSGRKSTYTIEGRVVQSSAGVLGCACLQAEQGRSYCKLSLSPCSGHQLCRQAWLTYLGIGKARMQRCKRTFRGVDQRTINQGALCKTT